LQTFEIIGRNRKARNLLDRIVSQGPVRGKSRAFDFAVQSAAGIFLERRALAVRWNAARSQGRATPHQDLQVSAM
ncbi:MAG: hypothetical protein WB787_02230, partial [Candidatus Acidiferrales bacterium]